MAWHPIDCATPRCSLPLNWACVDARVKEETASGKLHPGIVYERHYALNWLTLHRQQAWDNVTTDT